jgi:hypothetical protein
VEFNEPACSPFGDQFHDKVRLTIFFDFMRGLASLNF